VSFFPWVLILAIALIFVVSQLRNKHRRAVEALRVEWGRPRSRKHKMDVIAGAHLSRMATLRTVASLDNRTWNDLHMDDVFEAVDRTTSTLGQQALYHRLRTAPVADALDSFEALVTRMTEDAPTRERAQLALTRLKDPYGYNLWWLSRREAIETHSWYVIFPILAASVLSLIVIAPFHHALLPLLVLVLVASVATRMITGLRIGAAATAFRQLAPLIATAQSLQFLEGDDIAPLTSPLDADTRRIAPLKTISRWVSGDPFMLADSTSPWALPLSELANAVYEYLNLALLLDANGVYFGAATLRAYGGSLLRVVSAIGDVDAAISVASLRAERSDWTRPRFLAGGAPAVVVDAVHPVVSAAVPNSITLAAAEGVLVTGSNMSGKTTFLRTVGVSAVMAQTIHTCLATKYEAPIFNVRSCIGRTDDLLSGKSYYIVEVEALLSLVAMSFDEAPHLFLLDELFRGTNAVERIAAGQSVLLELISGAAKTKPHVVIAATHDGELVDLLAGTYRPCHFGDAVVDDGIVFDYRLKSGRATSRNAIALLRIHGAPEALITRALATAATLDRQRGN
jgi:hypothetical protein